MKTKQATEVTPVTLLDNCFHPRIQILYSGKTLAELSTETWAWLFQL